MCARTQVRRLGSGSPLGPSLLSSDGSLGRSPLGSGGPLGPSLLGSGGVLGPNLREHSHSESMAMMIITMISTRIDTQKRMGGDTALWLKAFVEVKK